MEHETHRYEQSSENITMLQTKVYLKLKIPKSIKWHFVHTWIKQNKTTI